MEGRCNGNLSLSGTRCMASLTYSTPWEVRKVKEFTSHLDRAMADSKETVRHGIPHGWLKEGGGPIL